MIKWLKQLFKPLLCKHEYKEVRVSGGMHGFPVELVFDECAKCGHHTKGRLEP